MNHYFQPIVIFTGAHLRRFFRDKVYIFFMFILPVMFLFIFGSIYGNNNSSTLKVALFNHSNTSLAQQFTKAAKESGDTIKVMDVGDEAAAQEKVIRGELDGIITLPKEFGTIGANHVPSGQVSVEYGKNSEQAGQSVAAFMSSVAGSLNAHITGQQAVTVKTEAIQKEGLTSFDYVFAGLIGYTILTIGLMGIANILPGDKESGAVKRLRATTISGSQLVLSYALTFLLLGALIIAIMVLLGLTVFHFHMRGSWLNFTIFTTIATLMMLGFGLAVGGWAKNDAQASALANLTMFPMMFLSGVFFPKFLMPEFMQSIMNFIPLTPVIDGIRLIMTQNYSLIQVCPQLLAVGVWGIIIYAVAFKAFRWE